MDQGVVGVYVGGVWLGFVWWVELFLKEYSFGSISEIQVVTIAIIIAN